MHVDVHSHAIPLEALDLYTLSPLLYGLRIQEDTGGQRSLAAASGFAFPLTPGFYDADARLKDMDARGVDVELVTPSPNTLFYDLPIADALPFYHKMNDGIAYLCEQAPDRLIPCGGLPLQDVEEACREVRRLARAYRVPMVLLNTSVQGRYYDDPAYLPLLELCEALRVAVMFHPFHTNTSYGLGPYYLTNLLGNAIDTTISATRLILGGVLEKFPQLCCIFVHGGGFLPYIRGRVEHGFDRRPEPRAMLGETRPGPFFDQLYFDTITHSDKTLAYLIKSHGADHILLGSDYPFDMADMRHAQRIVDLPEVTPAEKEKILSENIIGLLHSHKLRQEGGNL